MKKCEICGRESNRIIKIYGYQVCSKHKHQYLNYGKFLDNNPRTQNDPNEYYIKNNKIYVKTYDRSSNETGVEFILDKQDEWVLKKYRKWRISYGYPKTGFATYDIFSKPIHLVYLK